MVRSPAWTTRALTAARTHFDRWSATYETGPGARRLQELQTAALAALGLISNDVLLDLGCGTGAAVRQAAPAVRRAVGFDLSPEMIAQARNSPRASPTSSFARVT